MPRGCLLEDSKPYEDDTKYNHVLIAALSTNRETPKLTKMV